MNKFVYWVGVYTICVAIHNFPNAVIAFDKKLHEVHREQEENARRQKEKAEIGIHLNSEGKPMNKIGFSIEAE